MSMVTALTSSTCVFAVVFVVCVRLPPDCTVSVPDNVNVPVPCFSNVPVEPSVRFANPAENVPLWINDAPDDSVSDVTVPTVPLFVMSMDDASDVVADNPRVPPLFTVMFGFTVPPPVSAPPEASVNEDAVLIT